jgi:hypothetical protein
MSQRRDIPGRTVISSIAAVGVAAALVLTGQTTAQAAGGDVICDVYRGDSLAMRVTDNGNRTFHVSLIESSLQAQPSRSEDSFVPLPTTPVDLRNSRSLISLADAIAVVPGSIVLSQGVTTIAPENDGQPYGYSLERAQAPASDTAMVSSRGDAIDWVTSTDIRENASEGRAVPADFEAGGLFLAIDASTSVIEFDLTPTGTIAPNTDLELITGSVIDLNRALFSPSDESYTFSEDGSTSRTLAGCVIPARYLVVPTETPTTSAPPMASPTATSPTTSQQAGTAALANTGAAAFLPLWIAGSLLTLGLGSAITAGRFRRRSRV